MRPPKHDPPHLSLAHAYCILCRYSICTGQTVAAVIGDWWDAQLTGYTVSFTFPEPRAGGINIRIRQKEGFVEWELCRRHHCCYRQEDQATFLFHSDCRSVLEHSKVRKKPSISDIWTIGVWTEPFGTIRIPACQNVTIGGILDAPLMQIDDTLLNHIYRLPPELRENLLRICPESSYWRLLSALYRYRFVLSLFDEGPKEGPHQLNIVRSWSRKNGLEVITGDTGPWMFHFDTMGLSWAGRVSANKIVNTDSRFRNWYIVNSEIRMGDVSAESRGSFFRLVGEIHSIWDAPAPTDPLRIRWIPAGVLPDRARIIYLKELKALTVFCRKGFVSYVHPHYNTDYRLPFLHDNAPHPQNQIFHPDGYQDFTAIFFPLSGREKIEEIWARTHTHSDGKLHPDSFAITTTTGRSQLFGRFFYQRIPEPWFHCYSANSTAKYLLLPDFEVPLPEMANLSVAPVVPPDEDIIDPLPSVMTKSKVGIVRGSDYCYATIASLENVKQLWLFHRHTVKGDPLSNRRDCTGMTIEYENGSLASVGTCRRGADIVVQGVESPLAIHYKQYEGSSGMLVDCVTGPPDRAVPERNSPWTTIHLSQPWEIRWWFDDSGTVGITVKDPGDDEED